MSVNLADYHEEKPNRRRRIIWWIVNHTLFRIGRWAGRERWLKRFGTDLGNCNAIYRSIEVYDPANLKTGYRALLGPRVEVYNKAMITLGDNVVISQDAFLCTASHDITSPTMELVTKPITIKDGAWVAARAIILPGVTIGEGAVVGAGAVVAKDVEPWMVVVGNPARVVGKRVLRNEKA